MVSRFLWRLVKPHVMEFMASVLDKASDKAYERYRSECNVDGGDVVDLMLNEIRRQYKVMIEGENK